MNTRFLPDIHIESLATRLLGRYGAEFGHSAVPPIPVEDIADGLLDLRILWNAIVEPTGESILAGLNPDSRTIVFNDTRRRIIEDTHGLYNTVLAHEIGHWEMHVNHRVDAQQPLPRFDQDYDCLYQEAPSIQNPKEAQAHKFMGFLLMPSYLLSEAIRGVELTNWAHLYRLRDLFQVTISALRIRLELLGVLYVSSDGQLYNSVQEYHGQTRMAL